MLTGASLGVLVLPILVHAATPFLKFLEGTPRSIWLSVVGGVRWPCLRPLNAGACGWLGFRGGGDGRPSIADRHVFLIALVGLLTFYGLHWLAQVSGRSGTAKRSSPGTNQRGGRKRPQARGCSGST